MALVDGFEETWLVVSAASRALRGQLHALAWVTLEDVALDAVVEDGQLVARTSARQIAENLRVDPLTVAKALKVLRDRGLVRLEPDQRSGPARRFGLWVYVLGSVTGVTVVDQSFAPPSSPSLPSPGQGGFWRRRGSS
jgi:DNA-binding transcriptional ArsR family regulator